MKRVINFMGVRRLAFTVTLIMTLVSLGCLAVKGLNYGLDFTGGTLFIGITAGTYSSVYISSIFLIWLNLTVEDLIPPASTEEIDETP